METCVKAVGDRVPIIPGIAALSTAEAVKLAQDAKAIGCSGLMVLPPYVYSTDWREMKAHVRAVIAATDLPCMLYNNPIAYKTDFLPQHILELAGELPNLHAVKESSADLRRVMAIRALSGARVQILVGVDVPSRSVLGALADQPHGVLVRTALVKQFQAIVDRADGRNDVVADPAAQQSGKVGCGQSKELRHRSKIPSEIKYQSFRPVSAAESDQYI